MRCHAMPIAHIQRDDRDNWDNDNLESLLANWQEQVKIKTKAQQNPDKMK